MSGNQYGGGLRIRKCWSFLEMLKFRGDFFYGMSDLFGHLRGLFEILDGLTEAIRKVNEGRAEEAAGMKTNFNFATLQDTWNSFRRALVELDMELPADSFDRVEAALKSADSNFPAVKDAMFELQGRMRDELSHMEVWVITKEERRFLKPEPFGPDIATKFLPARDDLEEAGKCLAFGRGTACVFHLMRVMEVGLRALAGSLNDPRLDPRRNPSWDSILKKCDEELQKPLKDRALEWRADDAFFSAAAAQLHAVKDAWRNPTMHVERRYMTDEAEDVWNAVKGFMRHLAQRLSA